MLVLLVGIVWGMRIRHGISNKAEIFMGNGDVISAAVRCGTSAVRPYILDVS
jgi:hypothetical protein